MVAFNTFRSTFTVMPGGITGSRFRMLRKRPVSTAERIALLRTPAGPGTAGFAVNPATGQINAILTGGTPGEKRFAQEQLQCRGGARDTGIFGVPIGVISKLSRGIIGGRSSSASTCTPRARAALGLDQPRSLSGMAGGQKASIAVPQSFGGGAASFGSSALSSPAKSPDGFPGPGALLGIGAAALLAVLLLRRK